jgi:hypothetical protein
MNFCFDSLCHISTTLLVNAGRYIDLDPIKLGMIECISINKLLHLQYRCCTYTRKLTLCNLMQLNIHENHFVIVDLVK